MAIVELGHTGFWVHDLKRMRDFYERVLGLTVTDEDDDQGIVFLSSRPEHEHHEFVLQGSDRPGQQPADPPGVVAGRLLATLVAFHRRFREEGVEVQQEVTHGNALGIYFFDPEGNRNEVYLRIERDVRQPFRKSIDLDQDDAAIWAQVERLLADGGPAYQPVR